MTTEAASVARLAGLLADRTRMTLLLALLDGRAWTMGELAREAGVGASTASEQLSRLVGAGLLAEERQGRHRYLRIADPQVARMIEDLAGYADADHAPDHGQEPGRGVESGRGSGLRTVRASAALALGRTCYDHLAGRLGVTIVDGMVGRGLVDLVDGTRLNPAGSVWLTELGADVDRLRRPLLRTCLDWTERRPHLAGGVGAAIRDRFLAHHWIATGRTPRVVIVTDLGRRELPDLIGLDASVFEPESSANR